MRAEIKGGGGGGGGGGDEKTDLEWPNVFPIAGNFR